MSRDRPYELHFFHCLNDAACIHDGPAAAIRARLKALVKAEGLADRVRINKAGCFSQCGHGPMIAVYPDGVWYCHVRLKDVDRIFREHVVGGRPVEALRYSPPGPGANKLPRTSPTDGPVGFVDTTDPEHVPCNRCPDRS